MLFHEIFLDVMINSQLKTGEVYVSIHYPNHLSS